MRSSSYSNKGRGQSLGRFGGNRGKGFFSTRGRGVHQQFSSYSGPSVSSDMDKRPTCQICGKIGHLALKCQHRFDNNFQHEELHAALAAIHITNVTQSFGQEWHPDSGATAHVTNSTQRLHHSQPYHGSDSVLVGDGNFLPITHVGSTNIPSTSGTLPLKDVLVCPDIAKSLLSVSKLTSDYPCSFEFDCDGVRVKDKHTKQLLTMGRNLNGMYLLEDPKLHVHYSTRQISASDEVWHRRIGHPQAKVLQLLATNKAISIQEY